MTAALPPSATLMAVLEATWPAVATWRLGPWRLRDGAGGGKRVSAATAEGPWTPDDITAAEQAGNHLWMIRSGDAALDAALAAKGYTILDPSLACAAAIASFAAPPRMTTFPHWPPLQIAADLWAGAGIGPARLAVMHRVQGRKSALLARHNDRAVGVAFVALHGDTAMLHALEVAVPHRRQGSAQNLIAAAALWAAAQGAATLTLAVTEANQPARALYERLGMQPVTRYHYRQQEPE